MGNFKDRIIKELDKIYEIRKQWNGARGPFNKRAKREKELILMLQTLLENVCARGKNE